MNRHNEDNYFDVIDFYLSLYNGQAVRFFVVFSRYEYALKASGYIAGDESHPKADWDKFAKEISESFDKNKSPELCEAIDYLLKAPPKKQLKEQRKLVFKDSPPDQQYKSELEKAILLIRRIRNNLVHGSKFDLDNSDQIERNLKLLDCGWKILFECLEHNVDVKDNFQK